VIAGTVETPRSPVTGIVVRSAADIVTRWG